ncbi:MAG: ATP-binding protein [Lachnospiraceae bacterium]|nr:ATP-binding protein [Lachnospiraceae bacterium]
MQKADVKNPFNPSFGKPPELFLGRDDILRSIVDSIENPNSPWRTTLIIGVRGSGKTALLYSVQAKVQAPKIVTVTVAPERDFLNDILGQVYRQVPKSRLKSLPKLKSISVSIGVTVGLESRKDEPSFTKSFRYQLTSMLDELQKDGIYTIFLIDESQKHTDEMRTFISVYQHLVAGEYSIGMVLAGLPIVISDILNDDVLTFLRRAKRVELENVELSLVHLDYQAIFAYGSHSLEKELIRKAAECTQGYPYLFQLIGYYLWENVEKFSGRIALERALVKSKAELFRTVHELVFSDLSNKDREFIFAMIEDEKQSKISDIMVRMGKEKYYVSRYRERLISGGVIRAVGHGLLGFTYPYMREFLIEKKLELGY